jgi:hypothetical protein
LWGGKLRVLRKEADERWKVGRGRMPGTEYAGAGRGGSRGFWRGALGGAGPGDGESTEALVDGWCDASAVESVGASSVVLQSEQQRRRVRAKRWKKECGERG